MKKPNKELRAISKEIIHLKIDNADTMKSLSKKFYSIMKKHHICQGTKTKNGVACDNPEWVMCHELFKSSIQSYINWKNLTSEDIPEGLVHY